jgi:hypothetical protein
VPGYPGAQGGDMIYRAMIETTDLDTIQDMEGEFVRRHSGTVGHNKTTGQRFYACDACGARWEFLPPISQLVLDGQELKGAT